MKNLTKQLSLALITLGFATTGLAADISHSLRNNTEINSEPENYFELGIYAYAAKRPSFTEEDGNISGLGVVVNGSYNWKGVFVDLYGESHTPFVLGYNAYNSKKWSFDLLLTPIGNGLGEDLDDRFIGLDDRKFSIMAGGRATGYFAGNTVQLQIRHDISSKSKGTSASALVGRNWQYRNWNFHAMLGVNYNDSNFVDYYLGVSKEEAARTVFTAFEGEEKFEVTAEVGVTYPIAEDWVFRATTRYGNVIGDDAKSPLYINDRSDSMSFDTSISYVF